MTEQPTKRPASYCYVDHLGYDAECRFCKEPDAVVNKYLLVLFDGGVPRVDLIEAHTDCFSRYLRRSDFDASYLRPQK